MRMVSFLLMVLSGAYSFAQTANSITEATYPGGVAEMTKFIQSHLEIPADFSGSGAVNLRFVVDEKGEVSNVVVRRGIDGCEPCSNAAIAVMQKMPKWKPAYSNPEKKHVESIHVLSIKFEQKK